MAFWYLYIENHRFQGKAVGITRLRREEATPPMQEMPVESGR
jgi:hypothetical protein